MAYPRRQPASSDCSECQMPRDQHARYCYFHQCFPQMIFDNDLSGFGTPIITEAIIQLKLELQKRKYNEINEGVGNFPFFADFFRKHYGGFIESISNDDVFMNFIIQTLRIYPLAKYQKHFRELFKLTVTTRLHQLKSEQKELKETLTAFKVHPQLNVDDIHEIKENLFTVLGTSETYRNHLLNTEKCTPPAVAYRAHLQSKNYGVAKINTNNNNNNRNHQI